MRLIANIYSVINFQNHVLTSGDITLFRAFHEDNPNVGEKFMEAGESKNLFFLSVPNHYSGLLCDSVSLQSVERLITASSLLFDILLIDGSWDLTNPISGTGLWLAEKVYTLYRPSASAPMWHKVS